jgi:hypothetical protein
MEFPAAGTVAGRRKNQLIKCTKAKGVPLASSVPTVFSAQPLRKGVTY